VAEARSRGESFHGISKPGWRALGDGRDVPRPWRSVHARCGDVRVPG